MVYCTHLSIQGDVQHGYKTFGGCGCGGGASSAPDSGGIGVYSPVNRKGRGGVEPRTEKVGDGYAWYDVATWVPAPDEYLWIGPGRFNADGKSAINGVYVDKIRIVRVD